MSTATADAATNPLLIDSGLPDFARIEPAHVLPAVEATVQRALARLDEIEPRFAPTWAGTMSPIEELERPFEYAWSPVSHLFGVKNSPELRIAYDAAQPKIIEFSLRCRQSEPLYKALLGIRDGAEWARLDGTQRRIVEDRIKDAELAGIGLPVEQRTRFNEIEQELSQFGSDFSNHVLDATKAFSLEVTDPADAEGWPNTLRQLAAQTYNTAHADAAMKATPEAGPWRITLEAAIFGPFMEHCRNRTLREQLYRAFVTRASVGDLNNAPLIDRILQLRHEKAALLGYSNYAQVSLMRKMAPGVEAIEAMFSQLLDASWAPAQRDLQDLLDFKTARGDATPLALWDVAFWAERLREERYAYTDEQIRPYFPFEKVLDGLFRLLERLFDIRVEQVTDGVSTWHPDVRFFHIRNEAGEPIAAFFLDPYSRPENKRPGAWMDDCLGRRRLGDRVQLPVAHLVCNQTPPVGDTPALMTFREVETLFHEMGHGLQHMLTKIEHPDAAGIKGIEWDAVELPSQFMENWCYHKPTLLGLTGHYQTGEPLPDESFQKICAARNYRAATMMLRQIQFGRIDLTLHTTFQPGGEETVFDVHRRIAATTSVLPPLPEDRFLCSFSHIFAGGYAAGYYSYKWAEILSADAFGAFEEAGLDDPAAVSSTGRRFRDTVLSLGGSRHPLEVFRAFRGRDPSVEPLLKQCGLLKA
ncbi:MAG TPA: M3 family metallopeptidase [Planctomycetaceae bacterium]|nr:M3 family metallopeptidase [Planctomycetaceae bacterium]